MGPPVTPHAALPTLRHGRDHGGTFPSTIPPFSPAPLAHHRRGRSPPVRPQAGAPADPNAAPLVYPAEFVRHRLFVFMAIVVGYSCFYLTRNSLTYTAPVMVATPGLGIDITMIGAMTSIFPIAYGCSKFIAGVLGAKLSPGVLLGSGLIATAGINIMFGFGSSMYWFCFWWAMNGFLQGTGGPACARILTNWFAPTERGTYWGMWNIAHNIGGFLAPIIAGSAAKAFGWSWGMWVPGILGVAVGTVILLGTKGSPEEAGFPPVETPEPPKAQPEAAGLPKPEQRKSRPLMTMLVQDVLKNPRLWGLAFAYFFIYVVRQGVTSWFVFYLIKAKGLNDAAMAALRVSGLELGGLFGSLLAGRLSDALIRKYPQKGSVGLRIRVVIGYTMGIAAMLLAFASTPAALGWLQWVTVFMIGFFLYGPQMLVGLCGAEIVGSESVGASEGFLGWIAYLGAANAGIPLSIIVKDFGWSAYFTTLVASCGMAVVLCLPLIRARSFVQREAARKLKEA